MEGVLLVDPLTFGMPFFWEVVLARVRVSSLCICGSYAVGKLKREAILALIAVFRMLLP